MNKYELFKPTCVKDACRLLQNDGYMAIAGGTDMLVKIRNGFFKNLKGLVHLGALPLKEIKLEPEHLIIGSACTMEEIATNQTIVEYFPVLSQAVLTVGATQIRHMATIGGNVGNASPAGDSIPALYSLDAAVRITNGDTARTLPINEFFIAPGKNALMPGELIEAFVIPLHKTFGAFKKLGERSALAISKINLALSFWENAGWHYRIALGSVAPTVLRCCEAEKLLAEAARPLSEATILAAAELAKATAKPISDIRSTAAYRKQMAGVLLRKALEETN